VIYHSAMQNRPQASAVVVTALLVALTAGCAAPKANIMAMRDIPPERQERDRDRR